MVHVGIESGDQDILNRHKEGLTLDLLRHDIGRLHQGGLWVKGLFMLGFPGETTTSIKRTIDFACSLPLKDLGLTAFTPYPAAPIYADIDRLGRFDSSDENWKNLDCVTFVFEPNEGPSKHELEKSYREFLSRFYNRPFMRKVYRRMIWESPYSYRQLLINLPTYLGYLRKRRK